MQPSHSYCPKCGNTIQLVDFEQKKILQCQSCHSDYYFDPKVSAVCVLTTDHRVLLIKRGNEPGYGKWSLPGGYVDRYEIVEEAVAREILEEVGLQIKNVELIGVYSSNDSPVIVVAYLAKGFLGDVNTNCEVLDSGYFALDELPELAFPRDEEIIRIAMKS